MAEEQQNVPSSPPPPPLAADSIPLEEVIDDTPVVREKLKKKEDDTLLLEAKLKTVLKSAAALKAASLSHQAAQKAFSAELKQFSAIALAEDPVLFHLVHTLPSPLLAILFIFQRSFDSES